MAEKTLGTFRIDVDLWQSFKNKAEHDGFNASKLILQMIQRYLDGSLDGLGICLDERLDNADDRIDRHLEKYLDERLYDISINLAHVLERLDKVELALEKLPA